MVYGRDLFFIYRNPTRIVYGENTANDVGLEVERLGGRRAVLITDQGVVRAGLASLVKEALGQKYAGIFDRCIQDSGVHIVNEAADFSREMGADLLVSLGGGSAIDTTKGVAILLKEGGQLQDYSGYRMLSRPQTPHIAIPTTAGTGSEVTYVAVIKDWENSAKILFCDEHITPDTAILDPLMTRGLPAQLTAATGMDALTHAVEAFQSLESEPLTDAMALHAIRLIIEYLPRCVEQGDDMVARGQQLLAASMASMAAGNAQYGLAHAMAHSAGALFGTPHGLANSILLPHVMLFNLDRCAGRYARVALAMGLDTRSMSDTAAGEAAAQAVWNFTGKMGVPQRLRDAGVPEGGLKAAADLCLSDGAIVYNPRPVDSADQILQLYRKAW